MKNFVYLLTTGDGSDGNEWALQSIHTSEAAAVIAKAVYERLRSNPDGSTYQYNANVEKWEVGGDGDDGDEDGILRLEHLKRVKLEPGDALILETPCALSEGHIKYLRSLMKQTFGESQKLIVVEEGMKLGVVSPQEKSAEGTENHYKIGYKGCPICPHCGATTNAAYAEIPNLKCWDCGKPMEITTP